MKKTIIGIVSVLLALTLAAGCRPRITRPEESVPTAEPTAEQTGEMDETPDVEATFRRSTLYYISDEGFVVPVTKLIPWEEGIAKACLSYMVSTPENVSAAREMGLMTAIPEGVTLSLRVADGNALVDIAGLQPLPTREAELAMLQAIVNTLTEFPTVDTVTVTRDGAGGRLENGTELPVRREAYPLNPEEPELAASAGGGEATLWFPNMSGALLVPVTRYMSKTPSIYSAVSSLIEGTRSRGLRSCFPEGTLLLGAAIENGVATVNLSDDFKAVSDTEGLYSLAWRSLYLTLSESYPVSDLRIQVNGAAFCPEDAEPSFSVNEAGR